MKNRLLTKADIDNSRRQCMSALNWTDGGHWIGFDPAPNCFRTATVSRKITRVINFLTDQSAFKWNGEKHSSS
ncbi:MAG: hypothetical protein KDF60_20155 [Calditrichaeota bacterium]|nr:hypothetical protein [Calditrichota bacterium]